MARLKMGGDFINRFLKYFIWTVAIFLVFYVGAKIQLQLANEKALFFNQVPYMIFSVAFPVVIGLLLRLPILINDLMSKKRLGLDWIKLLIIGIPALMIAFCPLILFFWDVPDIYWVLSHHFLMAGQTFPSIAGVILGYVLLDSWKEK